MENLILYTIIFFIIVIAIIILYISLNPLEIKEKTKEKFVSYEEEPIVVHEPTDFQGTFADHYEVRPIQGTNEKYIIFKKNSSVRFPVDFPNCQVLIVGGGGGGGSRHAGGGGAGAVIYLTNQTFIKGSYSIIIGNGGQGCGRGRGGGQGVSGNKTSVSLNNSTIYSALGGGHGSYNGNSGNGGSGGGASLWSNGIASNDNIPSGIYGTSGAKGTVGGAEHRWSGGGGGGAESAGSNGYLNNYGIAIGGTGGNGKQINITGANNYYGGGGGGGVASSGNSAGNGGLGGGGAGTKGPYDAGSGASNTGGGGGGAGFVNGRNGNGGNGGSGVVIIRYTPIKVDPPPTSTRTLSTAALNPINDCTKGIIAENPLNDIFDDPPLSGIVITGNLENYTQLATANNKSVNYTVNFSSYVTPEKSPLTLFDYDSTLPNNTGALFAPKRYNTKSGKFIDTVNNIKLPGINFTFYSPLDGKTIINNLDKKIEEQIRGEWVSIKFPSSFILVSFSFVANLGWENKAPGVFILFGRENINKINPWMPMAVSRNKLTWENYANSNCEYRACVKDLVNTYEEKAYNEYLFVFPELASTDLKSNEREGHQLNFKEIKLLKKAIQDHY